MRQVVQTRASRGTSAVGGLVASHSVPVATRFTGLAVLGDSKMCPRKSMAPTEMTVQGNQSCETQLMVLARLPLTLANHASSPKRAWRTACI